MNSSDDNSSEEQSLIKSITDCCEKYFSLKISDGLLRRNALKEIHNYILICEPIFFQRNNLNSLLESLVEALASSLTGGTEKCRELSVAILKIIFDRFYVSEELLPNIFKTLALRLGKSDERENSEEIRILEMEFVIQLIEITNGSMLLYLNDISAIISVCLVDECPEIKRRSCDCLSLLANKEEHFHMVAASFLKPLLSTISHQHMKTRILCIKALGNIIDHLNSEEFEEAASHLAQRLFDHSPGVRLAVTEVVGSMLVEFKDRYSYFHRLIPMMLSTLYDEVPEIRSKGKELWSAAGKQFLSENDKDYKDVIDFPQPTPENYLEFEERPPLGCRIFVQRNIYKIFPPLLNDLSDWVQDTRVKCSKVLFSLILHSEDKITIQLTSAVDGVVFCAKEESKECVEMALKSAELLGYFVDPNLLCDTVMTLIHKDPSSVHLGIFAACLRGHRSTFTDECFKEICKFLQDPAISKLRKSDEQANVLLCVEALLSSGNVVDSCVSESIFSVLTSVSGLTVDEIVLQKAEELFKELAIIQSSSISQLFKQHSLSQLESLMSDHELWDSHSPEMPIFSYIVYSGFLDVEAVRRIIPVFLSNLHPSKDAKLRSSTLSLLTPTFQNLSSSDYELLSQEILSIISAGIFPNLSWSAGKTASKLRTIAAASLFEIINKNSFTSAMLKSLGEEILPILSTLADDDEVTTRLLACKILEIVLPLVNKSVDEHKIHNTCFEILHCMDDESDDVRMMTVRVLKAYVTSFPSDYNWNMYKSHVKHIYENVLVHMDDKNEKIRQCVLNLLKEIGFAAPDILLDEVESKRYVMSANDLCDNLIAHIKNIKV